MSDQVPIVNANLTRKFDPMRDGPARGSFWWVKVTESEYDEKKKKHVEVTRERLMCVSHLASNHIVFSESSVHGGSNEVRVRYRDLADLARPEREWKKVIERQIEEKKVELQEAVKQMTDALVSVNLIDAEGSDAPEAPTSLLPTLTRVSPEEHKRKLQALKKDGFPAMEKHIEEITQYIVALHRDLVLPMKAETERMKKGMKKVDQRLFALELYAGLFQKCKQIREGEPAPPETPITVRQMLRYMDEECLIDYASGGMDYTNVADFDEWVARPENLNRIAPEPRCIVALKVRRDSKDYGSYGSYVDLFASLEKHNANMKTYLLIRNGERVFRLVTEIEFEPRLLPFRDQFHKPFEETEHRSSWGEGGPTSGDYKSWTETTTITPDHLDYDKHVEGRMEEIYRYNRVMFLLQGLLDRSKVFAPHPPINLADPAHIEQFFKPLFDEEDGLPSHNPPDWERYRDQLNCLLVPGNYVWSRWHPEEDYEERGHSYRGLRNDRNRPDICVVKAISRNRSKVHITWAWGDVYGWHDAEDKPGYVKWGARRSPRRKHCWIPMREVFNISAYCTGDYKPFLCDAYQKGQYIKWAPRLLDGELWLRMKDSERKHYADYVDDGVLSTWLKNQGIMKRIRKSFKTP